MRGSLTGLLALAVLVATPAWALAETVKVKEGAEIFLRPGESSKVVVKVKSGEELTVLRRDGRWIKVRVRGRTGFIPRTKVSGGQDEASSEDVERQTRRRPYVDGRSTDRGWGGEAPDDRRGIDAVDNVDPSEPPPAREEPPQVKEPAREAPEVREPKSTPTDPKRGKAGADVEVRIESEPPARSTRQASDDDRPRELARKPAPSRPERSRERQVVRLEEQTALLARPGSSSRRVATAEVGEHTLLEEKGGWSKIETEGGERGWVSSKLLATAVAAPPTRRQISLGAQLGFTLLTQGIRTTGGARGVPDNYNFQTYGPSVSVGASAAFPVARSIYVGGLASYTGTIAKAFEYQGKSTGLSTHVLDVRATAGYAFGNSSSMAAWGRLGYHYDMFAVADVTNLTNNPAKIPSENLTGGTVGAAFTADRLTQSLGVHASFDLLVFSTREQTKNLEDGASPSTSGLWLSAGGAYRLTRTMQLDLGYRLTYLSNSFGAPKTGSMRNHMGTAVNRTDIVHLIGLGVNQHF